MTTGKQDDSKGTDAMPVGIASTDQLGLVERLRKPATAPNWATADRWMLEAADEIERSWAARDAAVADLEAHAEAEVRRAVAAERERCGQSYGSREVAMTAEIARLRAALTLAANRMDVLALDHDYGTTRRNITDDWAKEARDALGPNVKLSGGR